MSQSHTTDYRVQFRDTDAAGVMHFSAYFTYMEQAEHALWRAFGTSALAQGVDGELGWPCVSASCEFQRPMRFEELFQISVLVERLGTKSVSFVFDFQQKSQIIAIGRITTVCCQIVEGHPPQAISIPDDLRSKLSTLLPAE